VKFQEVMMEGPVLGGLQANKDFPARVRERGVVEGKGKGSGGGVAGNGGCSAKKVSLGKRGAEFDLQPQDRRKVRRHPKGLGLGPDRSEVEDGGNGAESHGKLERGETGDCD